jgi:Domain of unknown function (DUF4105)
MKRALNIAVFSIVVIVIAAFMIWSSLALWFRMPNPAWLKACAAGAAASFGLAAIVLLATQYRRQAIAAYAVIALVILGWWSTIQPPITANFAVDVAQQVTGNITGNRLTLRNVRNFDWRGETDVAERWEERTYDIGALRNLDLFLSQWDDSGIAHMIMSFGFADGRWLAWSVEVRRLKQGVFSPLRDLFKENPLVLIAAEERDVIGVRTNIRGEDVFRYRLNLNPETMRSVLTGYVIRANQLAARPEFYNSLTSNCTTTVVTMMRAVGATVPLDWRLLLNGRLPEYAFDHDALEAGLTLAEIRAKAPISARARAAGLGDLYSTAIRTEQ